MDDSAGSALGDFEERSPHMSNIPVVAEYTKCKVGPDEALYLVRKGLLISRCPEFFGLGLEGEFSEAQTNILILPEEDPGVFELFIHWIHQDAIPPLVALDESNTMEDCALAKEATYYGLYYLAEKWSIKALKNRVMDCIRAYHADTDARIHPSLIDLCFQRTLAGSLLRHYVVEAVAFVIKSPKGYEYLEQLHEQITSIDFLFDLLEKLSRLIDMGSFDNPNLRADCDFHEETQGGQCCAVTNYFQGDKRLKGHFHKLFVIDKDLEDD
ncbi:hypothetical protein MMC17_003266 [Xylographa soralifera]|nr:hypothetical protein [Xylographa soralifera]